MLQTFLISRNIAQKSFQGPTLQLMFATASITNKKLYNIGALYQENCGEFFVVEEMVFVRRFCDKYYSIYPCDELMDFYGCFLAA
jgi:hypothetical protein